MSTYAEAIPSKQGVEVRLLSLLSPGLSIDYEQWLTDRISLQGGVGLRSSAMADYSGTATTVSLGTHWWLHEWGPSWMRAPHGGFFAEMMIDLQRIAVYDKIDKEDLSSTYTTALALGVGFRIVIVQFVTISLSTGLSSHLDFPEEPARLQIRSNLRYGMRMGILF